MCIASPHNKRRSRQTTTQLSVIRVVVWNRARLLLRHEFLTRLYYLPRSGSRRHSLLQFGQQMGHASLQMSRHSSFRAGWRRLGKSQLHGNQIGRKTLSSHTLFDLRSHQTFVFVFGCRHGRLCDPASLRVGGRACCCCGKRRCTL